MKCPNCGKELTEGFLYCEVCGGEVRIVPDFEPELESQIHETLTGVAEEIITNDHNDNHKNTLHSEISGESIGSIEQLNHNANKGFFKYFRKLFGNRNKPYFAVLTISLIILVFVLALVAGINIYQYHSYSYQVSEALSAGGEKQYGKAIRYLERALEISNEDDGAQILLADYYYKNGNTDDAVNLLIKYIRTWKEPIDGYRLLISIYEEQAEYQKINEILLDCKDETIVNQFQKYVALPPEFSLQDSIYYEMVPLKILGNSKGRIYYTLDGSEPTDKSNEYKAPVFLDAGKYIVKAVFINSYGIKSSTASKELTIAVTKPYAPEVSMYSGTYTEPNEIEVELQENCEVYYTVDGSEPTQASILYTGPIWMPIGASHFKFITVTENGLLSDVTERKYQLFLKGATVTAQKAIGDIVKFQIDTNFITDVEGHSIYQAGRFIYTCDKAIEVAETSYYLVEESYIDPTNAVTKTGNQFAIDIETGFLFKAELNTLKRYAVTPLN